MGWRRASEGWRRASVAASGVASSIADGATLAGTLYIPNGKRIEVQSGGDVKLLAGSNLSLPDDAETAGAIAAPTIRATSNTDDGLAYDSTIARFVNVLAGVPMQSRTIEMLSPQTITAVGQSIAHASKAPIAFKSITTDANRTLTSNPCIDAGAFDGQIFILRGSGSNTLTLPDGNGVQLDGGANKALGPLDYMFFRWALSLTQWEQITSLVAD